MTNEPWGSEPTREHGTGGRADGERRSDRLTDGEHRSDRLTDGEHRSDRCTDDLVGGLSEDRRDDDPADTQATPGASGGDAAARIDRLERRVAALESELDAVRGLLGGVDAVDEAVEQRASIALAKVEALEREFAAEDPGVVRERLAASDDIETRSADPTPAERTASSPADSPTQPSDDASSSIPSQSADREAVGSDDDGLADRLRGVFR